MMKRPIFIVHFFDSEPVREYLEPCLKITCGVNDNRKIYLTTLSADLKDFLESLHITNLIVILLSEIEREHLFGKVDDIFYHDGFNPKMFDLQCFVRYHAVEHVISGQLKAEGIEEFYFCDSDIAITTNIDQIYKNISDNTEVSSLYKPKCFFSFWRKNALEKYTDLTVMECFFKHADKNNMRCSDMTYFKWMIEDGLLAWESSYNSDQVHLDPIRAFIYHNYLFSMVQHRTFSGEINKDTILEFPKGIWVSKEFIGLFANHEFWNQIFESSVKNERLVFTLNYELFRACHADWQPVYEETNNSDKSVFHRTTNNYFEAAMLHFQGPAKDLAQSFLEYWEDIKKSTESSDD